MFLLFRALAYATLFAGVMLVFVPARLLAWSGIAAPPAIGVPQLVGGVLAIAGAAFVLWCVTTFIFVGKGTPAPFDTPRRLVVQGPYRYVRNPMYIGAGLAMGGAALFCESWLLLAYMAAFFLVTHLFVVVYEEPTLRHMFGQEYEAYCRRVRRWWPGAP